MPPTDPQNNEPESPNLDRSANRAEGGSHTPGPWHTDGVVVWASGDGGATFDVPVCVMTSQGDGNGLMPPAPDAPTCGLENAALIAAAPDLLESVLPVLSISLDTMPAEWLSQLTQRIRAAILKAQDGQ